ncbi:hypothetical protein AGLY_017435 [Aphis glycines]|uniref:Uncharacterized protein n=1 Tax=Aphis glycines TaxID=307491 RepID=A0A6G0SVQ3_APHGL|nr:hypothetical protein AGLY_017435 [Aphis glycines]
MCVLGAMKNVLLLYKTVKLGPSPIRYEKSEMLEEASVSFCFNIFRTRSHCFLIMSLYNDVIANKSVFCGEIVVVVNRLKNAGKYYFIRFQNIDNFILDPVGSMRIFSLLFAIAVPSESNILNLACTTTSSQSPLLDLKVVPLQLPYLSNVPAMVFVTNIISHDLKLTGYVSTLCNSCILVTRYVFEGIGRSQLSTSRLSKEVIFRLGPPQS